MVPLLVPRNGVLVSQLLSATVPLVRHGNPEIWRPEEDEIDVRIPECLYTTTAGSTEPPLRLPLAGLPREEQSLLSDQPAEAVRDENDVVGGSESGVNGVSQRPCLVGDGFFVLEGCSRGAVMEGVNGDFAEECIIGEEVARPEDTGSRVCPG